MTQMIPQQSEPARQTWNESFLEQVKRPRRRKKNDTRKHLKQNIQKLNQHRSHRPTRLTTNLGPGEKSKNLKKGTYLSLYSSRAYTLLAAQKQSEKSGFPLRYNRIPAVLPASPRVSRLDGSPKRVSSKFPCPFLRSAFASRDIQCFYFVDFLPRRRLHRPARLNI